MMIRLTLGLALVLSSCGDSDEQACRDFVSWSRDAAARCGVSYAGNADHCNTVSIRDMDVWYGACRDYTLHVGCATVANGILTDPNSPCTDQMIPKALIRK